MIDYARGQGAEKVTIFVGQENAASKMMADNDAVRSRILEIIGE